MGAKPGDLCYFQRTPDGLLVFVHVGCHEHRDGVVTNPATLDVLGHADTMALRPGRA